jgi:hypothetical protein
VDFDLRKFRDENENVIKNIAFNSYVRNASATSLYNSAVQMLKKYQKNLVIHKDFPKEQVIDILRPYLLLYYIIEYSSEEYKITDAEENLKYKLQRLYEYNSSFGRKIVKLKRVGFSKRMIRITEFNSDHPHFDEAIDIETYQKTHLEIVDIKYLNFNNEAGPEEYEADEDEDEPNLPFVIVSPHPAFTIQSTLTVLPVHPSITNENTYSDSEEEPDEHNTESNSDETVIEGDSDSDNDDERTW